MLDLSRRDPQAKTLGADNVTMLLWKTIELVPGITRDELIERVGPRINEGHAKRRYLAHIRSNRGRATHPALPRWEDLEARDARRYLAVATLQNMRRDGSVEHDNGGYRVLRRPRTASYQDDDDVIDVTGELTSHHMRKAEAIKTLKEACRRFENQQPRLKAHELEAMRTLLELLDAEVRRNGT